MGLKTEFFGLCLGLETRGLGLGLAYCGLGHEDCVLVNITDINYFTTQPDVIYLRHFDLYQRPSSEEAYPAPPRLPILKVNNVGFRC